ncbi:open rectifier potassium channel protein 1 isoform X2 [Phymastichus coffea]|uniref:open rectifier potassium channel protein 1 isoform X2 n=1 Tax=Phymastichus coffea TaxID=108790 RepID=UPI00273AF209|nr:open rectifier potassium channel protein 1 isoform X2 [Phymastichus coffea]
MSKKQWFALLMLFVIYLLLGASIFYHIESRLEDKRIDIARKERIEINALLTKHYHSWGGHDQNEIFQKLTEYCGKPVYNYKDGDVDQHKWDFYNSFYFAYTVVSTIGYGNLAPTSELSRNLMIFYALVGIPINGILLAQLGEYFGQVFVTAVRKYKSYKKSQNESCTKKSLTSLEKRRAGLFMQIVMYLLPGFIMFIFFPAFLFCYYEGWTYDEAVYYAFVTLTTIGFGDYVAGQDNTKGKGLWFALYKAFLIVWILFGLGYIVMIMTFIGRGMTSKKIARLEHKFAVKLKHTQSKIWQEFNEDINYLRRVFNELQLSKVKRVYVDECVYDTPLPHYPRSNSFPNLRDLLYGGLEPSPPCPRRRANSEVVPSEGHVARVVSETDLQRIDKHATFATHAMVQPAELLARLVNILGYIPPPPPPDDDDISTTADEKIGVQGFSEKEILATEAQWNDKWILGADEPIKPCRSRATSEVRLDRSDIFTCPNLSEWTWSGPAASTKIQEIRKARRNDTPEPKDTLFGPKSRLLSLNLGLPKGPRGLLPRWVRFLRDSKKLSVDHSISGDDVETGSREFASQPQSPDPVLDAPERRDSYSRPYYTHTGGNLLEETSLADFLRALTALHSRVGVVPDDFTTGPTKKSNSGPQRKLGTASLTPPKLPSLLTLFSPPTGHSQSQQNTITAAAASAHQKRRFSLRTAENSSTSTPLYQRRATQGANGMNRPSTRRFSLRPVGTPIPTPRQFSYNSNTSQPDDRTSPPPYNASEAFMLDCPKKPLVEMEGAPGVSSPMAMPLPKSYRRFSLRPAQIGIPPAPSSAAMPPPVAQQAAKAIPRWKAGMLQRQLGQRNVQRRARAFSLSDVHSEESDRRIGISPLALHDNASTITSVQGQQFTMTPKTVTIVSPDLSHTKSKYQKRPSDLTDISSSGSSASTNQYTSTHGLRRYNSDIESISSKSSSHSSKSLDKDVPASSSSKSSSRKSSDVRPLWKATSYEKEDVKWDFPEPVNSTDEILAEIVKESEDVTRRLSGESSNKEACERTNSINQPSTGRKASIASIETWTESRSRKSSVTKKDHVRIDVPDDSNDKHSPV